MEPTFVPHFSHLRRAPDGILRGLREVRPNAELVYLGWKRWQLIEVSQNNARHGAAIRIGTSAKKLLDLWESVPALRANPGAFRRLIGRYDFATLAYDGARMVGEPYIVQGEPTTAIVDDYRQMDYHYRTLTDDDVDRLLNAPKEAQRAAARAQAGDMARANAAWRYLFTRSHDYGAKTGQQAAPRSGFVRHPSPSSTN